MTSESADAAVLSVAEAALGDAEARAGLPDMRFVQTFGIGGPEHVAFGKALDRFVSGHISDRIGPGPVAAILIDLAAGIAVATGARRLDFQNAAARIFEAERVVRKAPERPDDPRVFVTRDPPLVSASAGALNLESRRCSTCNAVPYRGRPDAAIYHSSTCPRGRALLVRWGYDYKRLLDSWHAHQAHGVDDE